MDLFNLSHHSKTSLLKGNVLPPDVRAGNFALSAKLKPSFITMKPNVLELEGSSDASAGRTRLSLEGLDLVNSPSIRQISLIRIKSTISYNLFLRGFHY
jgi:hypothetical protein